MKRYGHIVGYDDDDVDETPDGEYVLYEDAMELQRQLDAMTAAHTDALKVYLDIGKTLGASTPRELIAELARRRMVELTAEKARLDAVTAERDLLRQAVNRIQDIIERAKQK